MGLKQIIREHKIIASGAVDFEMELPGEPLIYSIKYDVASRRLPLQFFRNQKWKSMLRCFFRSYHATKTPVVIIVRYYVSAPASAEIGAKQLKAEKTPANLSYELCDYLLSLQEMIYRVLINNYRQVVKIDAEKYYSSNPRTVLTFMSWDHYVLLKNTDTYDPKGKGVDQNKEKWSCIQPERCGDEGTKESRLKNFKGKNPGGRFSAKGPASCDNALPSSSSQDDSTTQTKATKP